MDARRPGEPREPRERGPAAPDSFLNCTAPGPHKLLNGRTPEAPIMTVEINEQNEAHGHEHKDVSGGWLRPAVFGAMDGLVTNVSLIAGVGAGVSASGGSPHLIVLTGLAGLAAGAFSMATGEYVSVSSQNELIQAEVRKEEHELKHNAESEQMELAASVRRPGADAA